MNFWWAPNVCAVCDHRIAPFGWMSETVMKTFRTDTKGVYALLKIHVECADNHNVVIPLSRIANTKHSITGSPTTKNGTKSTEGKGT